MIEVTIDGKRISSRSWFELRKKQPFAMRELSEILGVSKESISGVRSDPPQWLAAVMLLLSEATPETISKLMEFRGKLPRWSQIENFPEYEVNEVGEVRRIGKGRHKLSGHTLTPKLRYGYPTVTLYDEAGKMHTKTVHRLVAVAFLTKPDGCDIVCHRNGIRTDSRAANLYWGTVRTNADDRVRHSQEKRLADDAQPKRIRKKMLISSHSSYKSKFKKQRKTNTNQMVEAL